MLIDVWGGGEMADAADLKSAGGNSVWVRIPPALLKGSDIGPFLFSGNWLFVKLENGLYYARFAETPLEIFGNVGPW